MQALVPRQCLSCLILLHVLKKSFNMKMYLFFLSLLTPVIGISQKVDKRILNTSDGESYAITTNMDTGMSFVRNTKNKLSSIDLVKEIDKNKYESSIPTGYVSHTKESVSQFYEVLKTAFSDAGKPLPKNTISAIFFYNKQGKIKEIEFGETLGAELAIDDIGLIERVLKKYFTFSTEQDKLSGEGTYRLLYVIRFDQID